MTMLFKIVSTCRGGGYRYCRTEPPHPKRNSNGLYPLHRVVAENKLGRLLTAKEEVHHDDENKSNDDPDNLIVKSKRDHSRHHALKRAPAMETLVCLCGNSFEMKPHIARRARSTSKSGHVFCSRSCAGKFARQVQLGRVL